MNPSTDMATVGETINKPPIVILRERLTDRADELRAALPSDIKPEQFIRALITSATINPEIQACTWSSVWEACMRACRDGLLPDGVEGAIVPYKSRAGWIPMYQGLLRRFRRSGQFKWITANVVRQGDEFHHYIDEGGEHFRHVPGDSFEAPIQKIYAMATTQDGGIFVTVLPIAEANKIRNMSRAARDDAPWKIWPEEMYKKTALRRLCKVLPSARDIIPPDDDDDAPEHIEPTAPAPMITRKPGASGALEAFAGGAPADNTAHAAGAGEGRDTDGVSVTPTAEGDPGPADDPMRDGSMIDPGPADMFDQTDDAAEHKWLVAAYKRGQAAKAEGHARKACPTEYREKDRAREASCWYAGWGGEPMPEFNTGGNDQ